MMEKFFWADQIAERIVKEKKNKEYICASGITPSGTIHIGNFREVITTDLVVKALRDMGKKVKFIYSWDDYDRFRKVPMNIPEDKKKEFENYIGMPLSEIPNPYQNDKSYAQYFEDEFEKISKKVGIKPKYIRQSLMNKKCKYAPLIKKAIDGRKKIMSILNKYRKESLRGDWMPVEVYCEKCGKDSTKILNTEKYEIEYTCECGNRSKFDFRKKGLVKMKWRIDWPARWSYEKVIFEPGGIDHSAPGGSYTTAKEISKEIFNYESPIYVFYDWIKPKGGTEFSSSKGNVFTIQEVEDIYEPSVLRFLFAGTRPNKGFEISFDNDVIKIYEDFDELERKYYDKKADLREKRIYEMSVLKLSKTKPSRISFRHMITMIQTGKTKNLSKENKIRAEKVANWLKHYGKEMSFEIQEKINIKLTGKQKDALIKLRETLSKKEINEEKLFNEFYKISESAGIPTKEFFEISYKVIIGKSRGPRLASLIFSAGKEKVIKLLKQI